MVGAGVMGAATAWALARRGRDVVVLEQYGPDHTNGSSHGASRIYRLAYPDPFWVDLARRARTDWTELETEAGVELIARTGTVDHGRPDDVAAIRAALDAAGVDHEVLDPEVASERWAGMRFDGPVLHQADGGRVDADATRHVLVALAQHHGADLQWDTAVRAVEPTGDRARVTTDDVEYDAPTVVVAAGGWAGALLGSIVEQIALVVTQESAFHFAPRLAATWPSFIHHGSTARYGLETPGEGVKVAEHHTGPVVTTETRDFVVAPESRARVVDFVREWFPGLDPAPVSEVTCLYTSTSSEDFVLDRRGPIVVASPCSGHGFKFAPLIGRMAADLADGAPGEPRFALA